MEIENFLVQTEFLLICGWLATVSVKPCKPNHIIRLIFFASCTLYGKNAERALTLLTLLDLLTVDNIYRQQTLKFIRQWHRKHLQDIFASHTVFYICQWRAFLYVGMQPITYTKLEAEQTLANKLFLQKQLNYGVICLYNSKNKTWSLYNFNKISKQYLLRKQF